MPLIKLLVVLFTFSLSLATDFTLEWDANSEPDIKGYNVYRGPSENELSFIAFVPVGDCCTFTDTGLTKGLPYYYALTAENFSDLESDFSNIVRAFDENPLPPEAPSGLRYTITTSAINLEWNGAAQFYAVNVYKHGVWSRTLLSFNNSASLPLSARNSFVLVSGFADGYSGSDSIYIY